MFYSRLKGFEKNQLYAIDNIGLEDIKGHLMAFSDMNNDNLIDLIVLSENKTNLIVYYFNGDNGKFELGNSITVINGSSSGTLDFLATNVVVSDFSGIGRSDLLVMGYELADNKKSFNQDKLIVKLFTPDKNNVYDFPAGTGTDGNSISPCKLANPHSSSFIDLDGDCLSGMLLHIIFGGFFNSVSNGFFFFLPDLFLVCDTSPLTFQIWLNSNNVASSKDDSTLNSSFGKVVTGTFPAGTGQVTFADIGII
ncbi:hypothetical protein AYI68_g1591 [Smittium mucronatum]|uniref:VCBS repeat-containing protein n=1 Tax=Smittium mucronatum TaxID=133383 RepID=A0A1R0H4Z0_9FUNG|nr:hypothetical protein AYI68_g1591 [Smittium mucronatum]